MILDPLEDTDIRELFDECLTNAREKGQPAMVSAGLPPDLIDAINAVSLEFPVVSEETLAKAKEALERELSSNT